MYYDPLVTSCSTFPNCQHFVDLHMTEKCSMDSKEWKKTLFNMRFLYLKTNNSPPES